MDASNELIVSTQNGVTISHVGGDHGHIPRESHYELNPQDLGHDHEDSMDQFDDDVPAHRRMTVTRVMDHAELADSVLSAQSAPTINISPQSLLPAVSRSLVIEQPPIVKREEIV